MKKFTLTGAIVLLFQFSFSQTQWTTSGTNIYNSNTGNVGIGTSTPQFLLDMTTTTSLQGIQLSKSGGRWVRLFSPSLTITAYNYITRNNDAGIVIGNVAGVNTVDHGFVIVPHWNSRGGLRVTPAGTVGIGTSLVNNPNGYTLAVYGKIGANEVMVENTSTTWADYVFKPNYRLRKLKEVENFITENQHLPEIPSAEEVRTNGHKLGEMDVLLLKKIEELTLYVIELEKKNDKQDEIINKLLKETKDN